MVACMDTIVLPRSFNHKFLGREKEDITPSQPLSQESELLLPLSEGNPKVFYLLTGSSRSGSLKRHSELPLAALQISGRGLTGHH